MVQTKDIERPDKALVEGLSMIGSATATGELARLGVRDAQILGPRSYTTGKSICGPAITLQYMPMREDLYPLEEYKDPEKQLHRHALYHTQPGDVVVVDARGDMSSGVFGSMMLTYFKGRGGAGIVIDGVIRDVEEAAKLGLGMWLRGVSPNHHTQAGIMPFAVNEPIACGGTLVMPGDIIIADDDGAVNVPLALAQELLEKASGHVEWEEFTRIRLLEGGDLRKYYPLRDDARAEYEEWKKAQG
ncbi:MAG: ribonuclease activity regulator RraA [Chloroflexi bacterium]|nr:ribonuclease activity regulator RraA [Chloroflexota bacterium]